MRDIILLKRYKPSHPALKNIVHYFWTLESTDLATCLYNMLPAYNLDIIFNFSHSNSNANAKTWTALKDIYVSGVNEKYWAIGLNYRLDIMGISFYPGAAYSFFKIPISKVKGMFKLDKLMKEIANVLSEKLGCGFSVNQRVHIVEQELVKMISYDQIPNSMIHHALGVLSTKNTSINSFCHDNGINRRKLERLFNTFIGVSPKRYQKIQRIQRAIIKMISCSYAKLSSLAYDCDFYDQSHFIRECKSFTGMPPRDFINKTYLEKKNHSNVKSALDISSSLFNCPAIANYPVSPE